MRARIHTNVVPNQMEVSLGFPECGYWDVRCERWELKDGFFTFYLGGLHTVFTVKSDIVWFISEVSNG